MTIAIIGTGGIGSVIATPARLRRRDPAALERHNESARMLAAEIGRAVARPNQSDCTHAHHN